MGNLYAPVFRDHQSPEVIEHVMERQGPVTPARTCPPDDPHPIQVQKPISGPGVAEEVELEDLVGGEDTMLQEVFADPLVTIGERSGHRLDP
jgi:hypothetical protein